MQELVQLTRVFSRSFSMPCASFSMLHGPGGTGCNVPVIYIWLYIYIYIYIYICNTIIIILRFYNSLRARATQLTARLTSTCCQTEVQDKLANLAIGCGQHVDSHQRCCLFQTGLPQQNQQVSKFFTCRLGTDPPCREPNPGLPPWETLPLHHESGQNTIYTSVKYHDISGKVYSWKGIINL